MSYGANRWAATRTRARSAGSSKPRKRRAKKSSIASARAAPKKRGKRVSRSTKRAAPKKRSRATKPRAARKPRAKKARLYSRYDPVTGLKARVPATDPRYHEWPSRKPSLSKRRAEQFKVAPLKTAGQVALGVIQRRAEAQVSRTASRIATKTAPAAGALAAAALPYAASTVAALAAGAASYLLARAVTSSGATIDQRVARANLAFRQARAYAMQQAGAREYNDLPAAVRDRLSATWKAALATAQAGPIIATTHRGGLD
jgi:hypothetical protein